MLYTKCSHHFGSSQKNLPKITSFFRNLHLHVFHTGLDKVRRRQKRQTIIESSLLLAVSPVAKATIFFNISINTLFSERLCWMSRQKLVSSKWITDLPGLKFHRNKVGRFLGVKPPNLSAELPWDFHQTSRDRKPNEASKRIWRPRWSRYEMQNGR